MTPPFLYNLSGQKLWLSAQRALFWEERKALVLSDLHFGKTGHFRKAGIAVPQNVYKEDLQRLVSLLHYFGPEQLIAVGDLFHSSNNRELDWFLRWRNDFSGLAVHLVRGNHDILEDSWYRTAGISVWEEPLTDGPFRFVHDPEAGTGGQYSFCGHIHPGVTIQGLGRQTLRFPCFYFGADHCILPAFSKFTGLVSLPAAGTRSVFALVENSIIPIT
ncbi:MAG TPA: ligase-associated DNA damage response endonuclease PdeM [Chitinophagaceae bacterium]|jgi:DNA ligase-associated metallophosphoesterase|nr:ligase-associated DNA damage response endonuclease PdeM [Chitinophagaceae bacterium]